MDNQAAGTESLKSKLAKELKTGGIATDTSEAPQDVKLTAAAPVFRASSSDVSGAGTVPTRSIPVKGDVTVDVPASVDVDKDPLIRGAERASIVGKGVSAEAVGNVFDSLFNSDDRAAVTLTQADRDAFIAALVSGGRYTRPFSLFNGAVYGVLRCRALGESEGIHAWTNLGLRTGRYTTPQDYSGALRDTLLTAQVQSLHGVTFPEMAAPLGPVAGTDTKLWTDVTPPAWVPQVDTWRRMPEAIVSALYDELKMFERRYWTMISHATDQNFWNPAVPS